MELSKAAIGALLFIVMIVGANAVMYGIVRGWTRGGKINFFESMGNSFNPTRKKEDPMDELRRKMEELETRKKE